MNRLLSLLVLVLLAGCAESFTGSETAAPATVPTTSEAVPATTTPLVASKFRNAQMVPELRSGKKGGNGICKGTKAGWGFRNCPNELGLVLGFASQSVMERYSVLERYKLIERYALMERYELIERYDYANAIDGGAVTVVDVTGQSDFSAFLAALEADPEIAWFEPDFSLDLPEATSMPATAGQQVPWSVAAIGGKESSTISGDGSGAVNMDVFVIDTGVTNPDLNVVSDLDFRDPAIDGPSNPADETGHGTHVAGIIGATDNTTGLVGVAPGARIHNLKVIGESGTTDVSVVLAAMDHVIAFRQANPTTPMVVNMSIGENVGTETYTGLDDAVATAIEMGVTVVVAAGNQGVEAKLVTPAHVHQAITVGAFDQEGYFTAFSNYGSQVDILAPGTDIVSLAPSTDGAGAPVMMTGTSMSAPHVAGAAALYLSANPAATPEQVLTALMTNARGGILLVGPYVDQSVWVGNF